MLAHTRGFIAPLRIEFSQDVALPKLPAKDAPSAVEEWAGKKKSIEQLMQLLQSYKDMGDSKHEPLLKFHNPRTFEDMEKPVGNFRAMALKAGDVPKFFDTVLQRRSDEAIEKKGAWWAQRRTDAQAHASSKTASALPHVPVPAWRFGQPVPLASLKAVTDAHMHSLQPARKLKIPVLTPEVKHSLAQFASSIKQDGATAALQAAVVQAAVENAVVEEGGKALPKFKYTSKAVAAAVLSARRAEVQDRFMKLWAKKLLVAPEQAVVPLKDVDAQLASKFEGVSPKYQALLAAVSAGPQVYGERVAAGPALSSFLLKREAAAIKEDFPASPEEVEGAALAAKLEDPVAALHLLLGPLAAPGNTLLSVQVRATTTHLYTSDRYMYKEGMKLADKYAAQEAALAEELKGAYGSNVDVAHFQSSPRTPVQQAMDRSKEAVALAAQLETERVAHADNAYVQYAISKRQELLADPSNIAFDELLYPGLTEETLAIELQDLSTLEAQIDDAEEEELWLLTLVQQAKHIQKHFGIDLPHSVLSYMDPVLMRKIDWETTNGMDDWDVTLEELGSPYASEQWGVESLSHHFLPLIRYRRMKARKNGGKFAPELGSL